MTWLYPCVGGRLSDLFIFFLGRFIDIQNALWSAHNLKFLHSTPPCIPCHDKHAQIASSQKVVSFEVFEKSENYMTMLYMQSLVRAGQHLPERQTLGPYKSWAKSRE